MDKLSQQLLDTALIDGHFVFASGRHAGQKFDFDLIAENPQLLQSTVQALAKLIHQQYPTIPSILTVASGANVLALPLKEALQQFGQNVLIISSLKNEHKNFFVDQIFTGPYIMVDDVFTKGTSAGKLYSALPDGLEPPQGLIVVLNRNQNSAQSFIIAEHTIEVHGLIQHPMSDVSPQECGCNL